MQHFRKIAEIPWLCRETGWNDVHLTLARKKEANP
jgi:hypothetical protein